ncbi:MAG: hypothetical protein HZB79_05595 [Deltaproteobacteria bacterium]|nr:hypothetical protein [Deltaproteobacteria bacterium]
MFFTLVIFFNLIFVSNTFASYSCETKASDLSLIQSEIDALNVQKTTFYNVLTNLKNWVAIQVGNRANEKSTTKNLEGKGSARYKDEIAELQTQIDELQTKINEVQASYDELSKTECQEHCNMVVNNGDTTIINNLNTGSYAHIPISIYSSCKWTVTTDVAWIYIATPQGKGSGEIYTPFDGHDGFFCNQGHITVTASDGQTVIITVYDNYVWGDGAHADES